MSNGGDGEKSEDKAKAGNDAQEIAVSASDTADTNDLKREISSRDLNMIAFSGSVGTGLIIGAGQSLHNGNFH